MLIYETQTSGNRITWSHLIKSHTEGFYNIKDNALTFGSFSSELVHFFDS